jgi:uncharacterized protein (DUF4415 family)
VFAGPTFDVEDDRFDYGEIRMRTFGWLGDRLVSVVWTPRTRSRRVISMSMLMTEKKHSSDLDLVDDDENPEWTAEDFARAQLKIGDRVVGKAEFRRAWNRAMKVGRPKSDNPKKALNLRLDADVVEHFKAAGPGWQTRINETLRKAAKLPPAPSVPTRRAAAAKPPAKKTRSRRA